jgi:hypothetical protein
MKNTIRKKALKIGALFCAVVVLLAGMALPVSADTNTSTAAVQTVQGKVTSVTPSTSFVIQNGNQAPITINVDQNTLYFAVPWGKSLNSLNSNDNRYGEQNKNKLLLPGNKRGMPIPSNWRSDLRWLAIFDVQTDFSSIQVGDTIIARVQTAGNLAKQVLIIKAPAIQQVKGTVTAVSGNTITITPTGGSPVTVTWNGDTKVYIKGQIAVQVNQYAVVVYNRTSMIALTINAQPGAPTPPPTNVLSSIAVTPVSPATLPVGLSQQFTAFGAYANGTTQNITALVSWASSNTTVATISALGLATGASAGSTSITASLSGITSPAVVLNVAAPALTSIVVTPDTPANLTVGLSQQFTAFGTYSNGTTQNITALVSWASSNTTVATISALGLATGASAGSTSITASLSGVISPAVILSVVAP